LQGLQLKISAGYNTMQMNQNLITPASFSYGPPDPYNRTNQLATTSSKNWTIEPQVNFSLRINQGVLDANVGFSQQQQDYSSIAYMPTGFASDALINNPAFASIFTLQGSYNVTEYRYVAGYGRINYQWANKYFLNITARRDGSSRFGPGKEFG